MIFLQASETVKDNTDYKIINVIIASLQESHWL